MRTLAGKGKPEWGKLHSILNDGGLDTRIETTIILKSVVNPIVRVYAVEELEGSNTFSTGIIFSADASGEGDFFWEIDVHERSRS